MIRPMISGFCKKVNNCKMLAAYAGDCCQLYQRAEKIVVPTLDFIGSLD
jgi:hypothetical protein